MYRTGHYGVALLCYAPIVGFALLALGSPGLAVAVGGCLGAAGWLVGTNGDAGPPATLALFGVAVGVTAIGSHLLADALTPAGVAPFWPLSGKNYTLGVARADNTLANYLFLALGVLVTALAVAVVRPSLLR